MKQVMQKIQNRIRRHRRIRSRISGTADRPRLAFFRSNKNVYAQLIDDEKSVTIVGVSSNKSTQKGSVEKAKELGKIIAEKGKEKGVQSVVFDKGGFMYTGSVEAFANAAREGGLKF